MHSPMIVGRIVRTSTGVADLARTSFLYGPIGGSPARVWRTKNCAGRCFISATFPGYSEFEVWMSRSVAHDGVRFREGALEISWFYMSHGSTRFSHYMLFRARGQYRAQVAARQRIDLHEDSFSNHSRNTPFFRVMCFNERSRYCAKDAIGFATLLFSDRFGE